MMENLTILLVALLLASGHVGRDGNAPKAEASCRSNLDAGKLCLLTDPMDRNATPHSPVSVGKAPVNSKARPNIILITADDLGNQLGCYGDTYARTPALDALAREGFRFSTTWVTQSSCSSSRSSIFTGLYPHQNGQVGLAHMGIFSKETPRLPNLLKAAGYRTGILGKLHVQPEVNFDFDLEIKRNWTRDVHRVARETMAFIESGDDQPFFLKISYFDPHGPFLDQVEGIPAEVFKEGDIPVPGWVRDNGQRTGKQIASFYNCITRIDEGVALLIDELKRAGRIENTMIIFFGDNGAPFPGGKTTCYEAGMAVPLIVYWEGGNLKNGQVSDELVSAVDIMPTILEACGVDVPENLQGHSLLPILKGEQSSSWRRYMFGEMTFHEPRQYKPSRTVRDKRYHLIQNLYTTDLPEWELYDLVTDPYERENLAEIPAYSDQLKQMKKELLVWRENTNDPLLDPAIDKKWRELSEQVQETNRFDPPVYLVK